MATSPTPTSTALGRFFILQKWATDVQVKEWTDQSIREKKPFFDTFYGKKPVNINDKQFAYALSQQFSIPFLDIHSLDILKIPKDALDIKSIQKHRAIPINQKNGGTWLMLSDPSQNHDGFKELKFFFKGPIYVAVVEHGALNTLIDKLSNDQDSTASAFLDGADLDGLISEVPDAAVVTESSTDGVDDAPIVKLVNKILLDAIRDGASDIHFEPYESVYRVRLRRDGILGEHTQLPLVLKDKISSRIKVMSKLDISEKRVPQDGRIKMRLDGAKKSIDFRVSTLPTLFGEKIVMRILDASSAKVGIEALGYESFQKDLLLNAVKRPYGMVLVTGPTGSGKTVSLYTCINLLNDDGVNISTVEDPSEINLVGINQVNINEKAGLTFSAALKSFLRQDPDVIMVGEIRDIETADIAIKAAQTGHMVLSTLHTNDAPSTLTRLVNMGVAPFNIASSVIMITAQRLARKLCTCKAPISLNPIALRDAGFTPEQVSSYGTTWTAYGAKGCDICKNSGYKGRSGIYQVMPITEEIQEAVLQGKQALDIARIAKSQGVLNLREAGLLKVMSGATSLEEILAVTNET